MRINVSGFAVDQEGGSSNIALAPNQEVCFDDNGHSVTPGSPDCKLDIYLEELATTGSPYKLKIIKGSYWSNETLHPLLLGYLQSLDAQYLPSCLKLFHLLQYISRYRWEIYL